MQIICSAGAARLDSRWAFIGYHSTTGYQRLLAMSGVSEELEEEELGAVHSNSECESDSELIPDAPPERRWWSPCCLARCEECQLHKVELPVYYLDIILSSKWISASVDVLCGYQLVSRARCLRHAGRGKRTSGHYRQVFVTWRNSIYVTSSNVTRTECNSNSTVLQTTWYELREWWWCVALVGRCWIEDERASKAS